MPSFPPPRPAPEDELDEMADDVPPAAPAAAEPMPPPPAPMEATPAPPPVPMVDTLAAQAALLAASPGPSRAGPSSRAGSSAGAGPSHAGPSSTPGGAFPPLPRLAGSELLPSEPLPGESAHPEQPAHPGLRLLQPISRSRSRARGRGPLGLRFKLTERTRQHQTHAAIRRHRLERLALKVSIQTRQREAPSSGAAAGAAEQMGPPTHALSVASELVHRTDRLSPTHATVLLHLAAARRRLFSGNGAPPADAAAAVVQTAFESFSAEVPADATPDERTAYLASAFKALRKLHQRWAKAEIAGVDPSAGRKAFRFGRLG